MLWQKDGGGYSIFLCSTVSEGAGTPLEILRVHKRGVLGTLDSYHHYAFW
jgi:hypothetical protein